MPENYNVIWSNSSEIDLIKIIDYIAEDNIEKAFEILTMIRNETNKLYRLPDRCRYVPELLVHNIKTYREVLISPWRIVYRIENEDVIISAVFDGRRNIEDILMERFLDI